MSLKYISRFLLFALLLTLVIGGRSSRGRDSSDRSRGSGRNGGNSGRGGNQGGNQGGKGGNQGGKGGNQGGKGGNQGGDDDTDDDDTALICQLGRTGTFYTNAQTYFAGGGCGCQYGPTRNALRELAAGYLIEFNRHLVENYDPSATYTSGRFESWFNEFATDDVQYTTSTGVMQTSYDGLDELTDEDSGFGYQLATGELDYRVEISPVVMTECDADGEEATFEGLATIYRINRNTGCTDGVQQTRSMFVFTADEDMWLASSLYFERDDIPDTCDA